MSSEAQLRNDTSTGLPDAAHFSVTASNESESRPPLVSGALLSGGVNRTVFSTTLAAAYVVGWASVSHGLTPETLDILVFDECTKASQSQGNPRPSVAPNVSPRIHKLLQELATFASYPLNWDGYEGVPASEQAAKDAKTFLETLHETSFLPRVGLSGDGEIGLFWDYGIGFINVAFSGDGTYSFYARDLNGIEFFGDDIPVTAGIRRDLAANIHAYA